MPHIINTTAVGLRWVHWQHTKTHNEYNAKEFKIAINAMIRSGSKGMCSTGYTDITNSLQSFRYRPSMVIIVIAYTDTEHYRLKILLFWLSFSDDQGDVSVAQI